LVVLGAFLALLEKSAKNRAIRANEKPFVPKWSFASQNSENKKPSGFLFRFYPLRGPHSELRPNSRYINGAKSRSMSWNTR
jgi:hypothetical protein